VAFSLAHDAAVRVRIHDVRGRLVRAIEVGQLPAGRHATSWDARDHQGQRVAAGAYLVRLEVDGRPIGSKRLTILH
jgi:flagellar hook assembly protein FlgD